jgi:pimeloyl-ACP methyl ester carboxylesterase
MRAEQPSWHPRPRRRVEALSSDARALSDGIRVKTTWPFAYASEALAEADSGAQVRHARSSRWSMPLVVLTRGRFNEMQRLSSDQQASIRDAWEEMQADLVTLSTRGTHNVASEAGHYVHLDQPKTVVDAILAVVAEAQADRAV